MSNQKVNEQGASASGRLPARKDGLSADVDASRLVIRDKRQTEPPHHRQEQVFSTEQTERVTARAGRNNVGIILLHPIPNESANLDIANVDWLGFSLRLPEGKAIHWLFDELRREARKGSQGQVLLFASAALIKWLIYDIDKPVFSADAVLRITAFHAQTLLRHPAARTNRNTTATVEWFSRTISSLAHRLWR